MQHVIQSLVLPKVRSADVLEISWQRRCTPALPPGAFETCGRIFSRHGLGGGITFAMSAEQRYHHLVKSEDCHQ
jgi:hypothetical protein